MFNAAMFFCFSLLIIPKETRGNALVFVFGFAAYQFIELFDSLILYITSSVIDYETTYYHVLSTIILYVILKKLSIKNDYISYIANILVALMIVNAIGWVMYDSYIDKVYYNSAANMLIFSMLVIMTWSLPSGRNFIKYKYSALFHSFNSKRYSAQIKQRTKEGVQR